MLLFSASTLLAQHNRITAAIDNRQRVALAGHVRPEATAANDRGPVDPTRAFPHVTMALKPSDSQQADLDQYLQQLQDPSSPNYHHWLTPEQYAERFGVSQADLDKITAWLKSQGMTAVEVARGRNWIAFSGSAAQIESAFGTPIHHYLARGVMHFANATEPTVPAAFAGLVSGIHGLTDFRMHPPAHAVRTLQPNYTSSRGSHYLAPDDVATIYDISPLYGAGADGSGQKIVVVGQSQIHLSDIEQFRSSFGLPAADPVVTLVPNTTDPGIVSGDEAESDLDIELAGGVARRAAIQFVYSNDVMDALQYAINQNLAPVISMSYGQCEPDTPASQARMMQSWAQQANAQGITWVAASGDAGGADCFDSSSRTGSPLSVDLPGAIPEVTSIGGTQFVEGSGSYWNSTDSASGGSALSYIPETAWNTSAADSEPSASGGGASMFFAKPSWQTGTGVPSDGARDVPDVSVSGSPDHDGYLVISGGQQQIYGGTSVGAPTFAGLVVLLNQYLVANGFQSAAGLGNVNPRLYALAQTTPSAFHDITTGNNMVDPCPSKARTCDPTAIGYSAGPGYDQVTGWGSIDAYNLVLAWHSGAVSARAAAAVTIASSPASITVAGASTLTATVKSSNGVTPTGSVTFSAGSTVLGTAALAGSGGVATATLNISGSQLTVGSVAVTAQYSGDVTFNGGAATATVTVTAVSSGPPSINGMANGASFQQVYAPGMILTIFGSQLAPANASASTVPLPTQLAGVSATINGVAAPLYYVSPSQLNVQIPYQTPLNSTVLLTVNNNGQTTSSSFRALAAAPGIFVDSNGAPVPNGTAVRGQTVTLYVTGDGAVSPALATGSAPAAGTATGNLPKPTQPVTVTVGGAQATIQFIGIPAGLVGVTQINYQVPASIPAGSRPVVVTVGSVSSAPVNLTITQ